LLDTLIKNLLTNKYYMPFVNWHSWCW